MWGILLGTPPTVLGNHRWEREAGAKRDRSAVPRLPPIHHVLMIFPNEETVSSNVTQKLAASQIDPMKP